MILLNYIISKQLVFVDSYVLWVFADRAGAYGRAYL